MSWGKVREFAESYISISPLSLDTVRWSFIDFWSCGNKRSGGVRLGQSGVMGATDCYGERIVCGALSWCIVMVHDPIACVPGLRVMTAHSVAVVFCRILRPIHDEPVYQCWRRQATWCWCWTSPVAPCIWSRRRLPLGYLICFQVISVHFGFISSDTYGMKIALFLAHSWRSVQIECKLTSDHLSAPLSGDGAEFP